MPQSDMRAVPPHQRRPRRCSQYIECGLRSVTTGAHVSNGQPHLLFYASTPLSHGRLESSQRVISASSSSLYRYTQHRFWYSCRMSDGPSCQLVTACIVIRAAKQRGMITLSQPIRLRRQFSQLYDGLVLRIPDRPIDAFMFDVSPLRCIGWLRD